MGTWGSGAAGGIGYALETFYRGKLVPLSMFLLVLENFEKEIRTANAIILGADKLDSDFFNNPARSFIIKQAKRRKVPIYAVVGSADPEIMPDFRVFEANHDKGFSDSKVSAKEDLRGTIRKLIHEL
jgi:glycerate kinase